MTGSMRGSGIYATDYDTEAACDAVLDDPVDDLPRECEFVGEVTVHVDDWHRATWRCPSCDTEHEVEGVDLE